MAGHDEFDAGGYLSGYYKMSNQRAQEVLRHLHRLFATSALRSRDGVKVLDYGCGPVVQNCISAAAFASEIVFCDISRPNREAVQKWLDRDAGTFDWSPHFDYVVKTLEGKSEEEARAREEKMREVSKVVFCDALSEKPLETGFEGPYDIVLQIGCLEAACPDKASYGRSMKVVTSLVKPGGLMVNHATDGNRDYEGISYRVGGKDHSCVRLTTEYVVSQFRECGFTDIQSHHIPLDPNSWITKLITSTANGRHFIYGTRV